METPELDLAYLALASVPGIGPRRLRSLIDGFGTAEAVLSSELSALLKIPGVSRAAASAIKNASVADADRNVRRAQELGAVVLIPQFLSRGIRSERSCTTERFPGLLEKIPNPPTVLYAQGDLDLLNRPTVAVVGARDHTSYGRSVCESLVGDLASAGLVIASGMARGIDALAHSAALERGGKTLGVLGNGLGVVYPAANRNLYDDVARRGCLLTEFPPGERPTAGSFPRRNRLISGLSRVTLVVEAKTRSGALITADCALDQGREVMAVPGPISSPYSEGCNRLIGMGAKPALTAYDVLEEYGVQGKGGEGSNIRENSNDPPLVKALRTGPSHVDQLALELNATVSQTLTELTTLEIDGRVAQEPGKIFRLV
jgi:DNA processing protein